MEIELEELPISRAARLKSYKDIKNSQLREVRKYKKRKLSKSSESESQEDGRSKKRESGVYSSSENDESEEEKKPTIKQNDEESQIKKQRRVIAEDVSGGTTPFPIPVINDFDDAPPPTVKFIKHSIEGAGVTASPDPLVFTPGCSCTPSCDDSTQCLCAGEMFGRFPYKEDGSLSLPKGYPIYECNLSCKCGPTCRNRVVQKGPQFPLEIFRCKHKGWGVRALVDIPKKRFVCEYMGEIITSEEAEKRGIEYDKKGLSYLYDLDVNTKNNCYCIDATLVGNISRFLNHSCEPNLQNYSVWIDNLDPEKPRIAFFSNQHIKAGEELTFDYKYERNSKKDKNERIRCFCGALKCKQYLF
eukprot:TRINITY_DN7824_c0_g1_i1.p1 TRINITY_DN7824_c0_g1~~TRINITY_DN7824_c0_g1_i1.p1  ORF type:complete len:358 (+),score=71.72 TRINITY_DN7824_c0_g1_i1:754-1827(+)